MKINKGLIWIIVLVGAFVIGWLAYKAFPLQKNVSLTEEVTLVDTASWGGFHRVAEYLNLHEEQRVLFYDSERSYRDSLFYLRQQLVELDTKIMKALSASEPDKELLSQYAHESGSLQQSIKHLTVHHFLYLRELCTPEQQEKLTTMFSQMHQGYGQRQRGQGQGQGMQRGRRNRQN
jgi:Spy/CpxP family protein refolding chaperone